MDIHTELDHKISGQSIEICRILWELLYADATMLIGTRARELNMLMKAIEEESEKYNVRLNYDKCNYLAMYGKADIKFSKWLKNARSARRDVFRWQIGEICIQTR